MVRREHDQSIDRISKPQPLRASGPWFYGLIARGAALPRRRSPPGEQTPMTRPHFSPLIASILLILIGASALAQTAPQLQSAASRKNHAGVNYDLGLPRTGTAGI